MTTPVERTRALRIAGQVLRESLAREDVPDDFKKQIKWVLRHYPTEQQLTWMVDDLSRPESANQSWLALE